MLPGSSAVVVTGANGFVGARVCRALVEHGAAVRAIVRRAGTAPELENVTELVGDFTDRAVAAAAVAGADSVVSTIHPMGSDRATQDRIGVQGTIALARAAAAAGVARFVHVSTAAVYDRSPGVGDVDESSPLVSDDAGDYAVTKRDADLALAEVAGMTRVLLRPPAILGPGPRSIWNTLRPAHIRDGPDARRANPAQTFAWVHVTDLVSIAADLAVGRVSDAADPAQGPLREACTPLNVAAERATVGDYFRAVTEAVGVDPVWEDEPAWTGRVLAGRAHGWGWAPTIDLTEALAELRTGVKSSA